jgi:hypothetical protein
MKRLSVFSLLILALSGTFFLVAKAYSNYKKNSPTDIVAASVTQDTPVDNKSQISESEVNQPPNNPAPDPPLENKVSEDKKTEKIEGNSDNSLYLQEVVQKITFLKKYPAQILDLTNWKQTLPTGSSKKPREITSSALQTFIDKTCFRVNSTFDGVVFHAPVNGVTTSNSGYPRSELREMIDNGKQNASWSTTSGTHTMFISQAITAVPQTKKHIVAGQIHDANDDVIVIRLEYPKLFVDINGKQGPVLDPNYTLGKKFTIKFVAAGGKINIFYNGGSQPAYTLSKKGAGYYFKAGAYIQSNCSKEKNCSSYNYGEVVIYKLEVQHD